MTGTPDAAVLDYAQRQWPVFPCHWHGECRKRPLVVYGLHAATRDEAQIRQWWQRWPSALIGVPTGKASGFVVLDIDVKDPRSYGYDTLAELGFAILPVTRMVHTSSDGLHLHFDPGGHEIRNTAGKKGRGIGRGLDWRGEGGYVIVPSPGSGYWWDPHWNLDNALLAPVPAELMPREPIRLATDRPVRRTAGLSPYAEAVLDGACRRIIGAPDGEQEQTLNAEAFAIGTLAGAGAIPSDFARGALIWAARQIPDYDHRHPWRAAEIVRKVNRAFEDGVRHPREARRA
jgi:putative DNA primase/helicase